MSNEHERMAGSIIDLAVAAGHAIMRIYERGFDVDLKADDSPITEADRAAHRLIRDGLAALEPGLPLISEEGAAIPWQTRRRWPRYWLVDPLDGTREFVKRNGEFSVNIALVEDGIPVLGVVHAPATGDTHYALRGVGAWRLGADAVRHPLQTRRPAPGRLRVAASRSHLDPRTAAMLERIGEAERIGLGSSLKFCRIAEGLIDLYPRFGPTSEWDTAAGHCVLEAAGGAVLGLDGLPLRYNGKDSLLNPHFIAVGDAALPWREWLDHDDAQG